MEDEKSLDYLNFIYAVQPFIDELIEIYDAHHFGKFDDIEKGPYSSEEERIMALRNSVGYRKHGLEELSMVIYNEMNKVIDFSSYNEKEADELLASIRNGDKDLDEQYSLKENYLILQSLFYDYDEYVIARALMTGTLLYALQDILDKL